MYRPITDGHEPKIMTNPILCPCSLRKKGTKIMCNLLTNSV